MSSLFVTYGVGNDFFFSGLTALIMYGSMAVAMRGAPALRVAAVLLVVFQRIVVILLRAHWTMDGVAGPFAALIEGRDRK